MKNDFTPNLKKFLIQKSNGMLYGGLLLYSIIIISHMDFIPMWDGRVYFDELAKAIAAPFNLLNFNIVRHPTMLYMFLIALPQYLDFGNPYLLHTSNLILGLIAIFSFNKIIYFIFPEEEYKDELGFLTIIFSIYPLFLSSALNLNPDFGVMVFSLLFIFSLMLRKKIISLVWGFFLVFSKESGLLLYIAANFFFFVFFIGQTSRSTKEKIKSLFKWGSIMLLPPAAYVGQLLYVKLTSNEAVLWQDSGDPKALIKTFTSFTLFDNTFLSYMSGIFIINFNWIFSIFILIIALKYLIKIILGNHLNSSINISQKYILFFNSMFISVVFLLTRYSTFSNLRYILPVFPFLLITFYYSIISAIRKKLYRQIFLVILTILIFFSTFRTIDPISRSLYGTFKFGEHSLLIMTRFTNECCGYGRDQLVYNLEYTKFHDAQNAVYQYLRPDDKTIIVTNPEVDWHFIGKLDQKNSKRTINNYGFTNFVYTDPYKLYFTKIKPETIFFVAYPNFENDYALNLLRQFYLIDDEKRLGAEGYMVKLFKMKIKTEL